MTLWLLLTKHPSKRDRFNPKHRPGKRVGSMTPRENPTEADKTAINHNTMTARFRPTGKKRGSRKTYTRNPERMPDKIPEK